jgi:tetratricopeptide (TPR) repeat protein
MKSFIACASLFVAIQIAVADQPRPAVLMEGLGNIHHPVSTKNAEAQKFFDQGLRLIYGFNHDEAHRAFQRAAELDPQLGMAYWGMALVLGPNYNRDADDAQLKDAYAKVQIAVELSKHAPEHERRYIDALTKRYAADPTKEDKKQLLKEYKQAMGELCKLYPDDLDAATLYAESAMNLRPWDLWSKDGKPYEGTEEIVSVLESVIRRNPDHTGANHYLIHALEASPKPEHALAAADRLAKLAPKAGHLVHMPAHIHIRVGDYDAAAAACEKAAAVDHAYFTKLNITGVYPMQYYSHNLHFGAAAHAMQGRYSDAMICAEKLVGHAMPHVEKMPMLDAMMAMPTIIQVRFQRWDDILKSPASDAKLILSKAIWHHARGMAFVAKNQLKEAEVEISAFEETYKTIPEDRRFRRRNMAKSVLDIPRYVLKAKFNSIAKTNESNATVRRYLVEAVAIQDELHYAEPPDWPIPVREALGAALLRMELAEDAEKVFRKDLEINRRNPRSLFGLMESLKAQGKTHAAEAVQQQFEAAWRNAEGLKLLIADW